MAQGWQIDPSADTITFLEAPANGAAIVVKEYPTTATGATDVWAHSAWSDENGYPAEVEFFSDRLVFAGTPAEPQTLWFSKAGSYVDFGRSSPIVDDDSISATLNARQQNAVMELAPLDKLLLFTTGGEWKTATGQDDVLAPSTIAFKPQSYNGASQIPALIIGNTALYVQNRGYVVRDIQYQFDVDGYTGGDLTVFSSHLTEAKPIAEWSYQQVPFSIVWVVRDDGVLLALTYMREQEVVGWTPMEVDGEVESVCCVPEGGEDVVYIAIKRTVDGQTVRYVERLASRLITDIRQAKFLDSFLTYDGRNTAATTMTATGASWNVGDQVTLTASAATFASGDLQDVIVMGYEAGANARLRIIEYTSGTVVTAEIDTPVAAAYQATAVTDWGFARDVLTGYEHLAGRTVGVLCDGFVQDERVVTAGGQVTLDEPGVLVHVGLPYVADFETLEINVPGGESPRINFKNIPRIGLIVQDTRNIKAGPDFSNLDEYESRGNDDTLAEESTVGPPSLLQDCVEIHVTHSWSSRGRICARQDAPLPMGILGILFDVEFGR